MSANPYQYNPYNYDPLRVVDPGHYQYRVGAFANPTPQLGQVKQDAGWDYAANPLPLSDRPATPSAGVGSGFNPNAKPGDPGWRGSVDYTAAGLANAQGGATGTWNVPGWAYGGNQLGGGTYDQATGQWHAGAPLAAGSDVYGAKLPVGYNAAGDRGHMELNGQNVETFWSKFLRFSRDYNQGGIAPEQAMHLALSRLRDDNGGTLAGTGFDDIPDATAQAWHQAIQNTSNPQGANPVDPSAGLNTVPPAQPVPAPAPAPTAQTTTPAAGGMFYGQAPGEIANSPDLAYRALLLKMGINPDIHGMFSNYLKQRLGPAVQAIINAGRANGALPANFDQTLGDIGAQAFGPGGNWMQYAGDVADKALANLGGTYGANADMSTLQNYIQSLIGLKTEGLNPVAASGLANSFQDTIGAYGDQGLQNGGKDKSSFLPYFQGTNFYKSLAGR